MKKINKYLLFGLSVAGAAYADSCIDRYKAQFANKQIMLSYSSDKPDRYFVGLPTEDTKKMCSTTYQQLQRSVASNYRKTNNNGVSVVTGWNYLAINDKIVYDFLGDISPQKIKANTDDLLKNSDFKSYTADNQAEYRVVSILNQQYACYYHQQFSMTTGSAHPYTVKELLCSQAGDSSKILQIGQVADEKQIVRQLLQTKILQDGLTKDKINVKKISTYTQLTDALAKSNDPQLSCISDTLNAENTGFTVNKLNSDGTVDITMGLTSDIHVCSSVFIPVTITGVKPLMKISQIIPAKNL